MLWGRPGRPAGRHLGSLGERLVQGTGRRTPSDRARRVEAMLPAVCSRFLAKVTAAFLFHWRAKWISLNYCWDSLVGDELPTGFPNGQSPPWFRDFTSATLKDFSCISVLARHLKVTLLGKNMYRSNFSFYLINRKGQKSCRRRNARE